MAAYRDRADAGRQLAARLDAYRDRPDLLILALPRGGVPVAFEIARALHAPLDVFLVRKLGVPGHQELAMGAIASGGTRVLNLEIVQWLGLSQQAIEEVAEREGQELARRERAYRDDRPPPQARGRTVILVDDGLATGATMRAAAAALRQERPARLVIAVPVAAPSICAELRAEVDDVVCALTPEPFRAVGVWYDDFSEVSDDEVRDLLAGARLAAEGDAAEPRVSARSSYAESEDRHA